MGMLLFCCPRTGEKIKSGVHTDGASLAKVRSLSVKVYCQSCKTTHLMRAGDGQIEGDPQISLVPSADQPERLFVAATHR
jgi:hypothetical protein